MRFCILILLGIFMSAGCATGAAHFRSRDGLGKAAFDLGCDESKLVVTELSSGSVGVSGCGRRGRYELVPPGQWLLNSRIDDAPALHTELESYGD